MTYQIGCDCPTCSGYCGCGLPGHHDELRANTSPLRKLANPSNSKSEDTPDPEEFKGVRKNTAEYNAGYTAGYTAACRKATPEEVERPAVEKCIYCDQPLKQGLIRGMLHKCEAWKAEPPQDTSLDDILSSIEIRYHQGYESVENAYLETYEAKAKINRLIVEARYKGAVDCATWVMQHDESSFRQERAWFKVKPGLFLKYQAELLKELGDSNG